MARLAPVNEIHELGLNPASDNFWVFGKTIEPLGVFNEFVLELGNGQISLPRLSPTSVAVIFQSWK